MMNLAEYRNRKRRLADYLPWAALIGPGIVLNKDGCFQRTARFRGPDLDSAVAANWSRWQGAHQQRLSAAGVRLGDLRRGAAVRGTRPIPTGRFPDPASALLDAERKAAFEEAGHAFRVRLFPDLPLAAAGGGCRPCRDLAL